jgi:SAM-dependent methyltransferase
MDKNTAQKLIDLNLQFYQRFSASFSSTRFSVQPGVKLTTAKYIIDADGSVSHSILDIGCGNGEFARYLGKQGFAGGYTGLDSSPGLLGFSNNIPKAVQFSPIFLNKDITSNDWDSNFGTASFDRIVSFAVLHHIPGHDLRNSLFASIRRLLLPDGFFILSNWQFMNSKKLAERVVPWEEIGISRTQVDEGDTLLDWRAEEGKTGYRYVHLFSEDELAGYAKDADFKIIETFYSDGREGNLALYQVWQLL